MTYQWKWWQHDWYRKLALKMTQTQMDSAKGHVSCGSNHEIPRCRPPASGNYWFKNRSVISWIQCALSDWPNNLKKIHRSILNFKLHFRAFAATPKWCRWHCLSSQNLVAKSRDVMGGLVFACLFKVISSNQLEILSLYDMIDAYYRFISFRTPKLPTSKGK